MSNITVKKAFQVAEIDMKYYNGLVNVSTTLEEWTRKISTAQDADRGGIFFQTESDHGSIAFKPNLSGYVQTLLGSTGDSNDGGGDGDGNNSTDSQNSDPGPVPQAASYAQATGVEMMNLYSQMRSGIEIVVSQGGFAQKPKVSTKYSMQLGNILTTCGSLF